MRLNAASSTPACFLISSHFASPKLVTIRSWIAALTSPYIRSPGQEDICSPPRGLSAHFCDYHLIIVYTFLARQAYSSEAGLGGGSAEMRNQLKWDHSIQTSRIPFGTANFAIEWTAALSPGES